MPVPAPAPVPDRASGLGGVYAIPLSTPDESFWAPLLDINGTKYVMDLDTGSTTTGIAASTCTNCSVTPEYAPGATATDQHMTSSTSYADGTGWSGEIYQDAIGLDNSSPTAVLNIVAITKQMTSGGGGFFSGNQYQGILGMGAAANAEPNTGSYFDTLTAGGVDGAMAFELCPNGGTMWLGGFDASHTQGAMQYTPMLAVTNAAPFFALDINTMSLDGKDTGGNPTIFDQPVVDTGTSLFYLPTSVEASLISSLNANAAFKTLFPATTLKDDPNGTGVGCTKNSSVTEQQVEAMLPPLVFTMPNKAGGADISVSVPPLESYLYDAGSGQFCLGIEDGGNDTVDPEYTTTMGDQIMQGFVTVIDVQHQQIGWALKTGCGPAVHQVRDRATWRPHPPKRLRR